ncbi:hypothetical protein LSAT2_010900 [Lamellibrachia satsuma]|nr:hypothetical protein LSAT2_010900 [Lamellibrachia satsuma]
MRKRSADQKMRIHVYYDPDTIPALPARKRNKIKNEFIPASVEYFKNTLKVRRATTPIKLFRLLFNIS